MKLLLFLFIMSSFLSLGQDTLIFGKADPDSIKVGVAEFQPDFRGIDCAHGHMCCAVGCSCCQELLRPQVYDTAIYSEGDGIKRYEIFERYYYAAWHAPSAIQYLFKNKKGEITAAYYSHSYTRFYQNEYAFGMSHKGDSLKFSSAFKNGDVAVFDDNKRYHIINRNGELVKPNYHSKELLTENLYRVSIFVGQKRIYGLANEAGDELGKGLSYSSIEQLTEDGTIICIEDRGSQSLVNKKGEEVISTAFGRIKMVAKGLYSVQGSTGCALHTLEGERISEYYESIDDLSDGMIAVRKNQKIGFINAQGELVIKVKFEWAYSFSDGLAAVINKKKWGFIDKTGELVIDYQYDQVRSFNENRAVVAVGSDSNKDKWGVIDEKGKYVVDPFYDELYGYKNGLCKTRINGSGYGFIDLKGREKVPPNYFIETYGSDQSWFRFDVGVMRTVGAKGRLFLVDSEGQEILDLADYYSANYVQITNRLEWLPYLTVNDKSKKNGMIDFEGRILIPCKWDQVYVLNDEVALLAKGNQWYVYNYKTKKELFLMKGTLSQLPSHDAVILQNEAKELSYFKVSGAAFKPY